MADTRINPGLLVVSVVEPREGCRFRVSRRGGFIRPPSILRSLLPILHSLNLHFSFCTLHFAFCTIPHCLLPAVPPDSAQIAECLWARLLLKARRMLARSLVVVVVPILILAIVTLRFAQSPISIRRGGSRTAPTDFSAIWARCRGRKFSALCRLLYYCEAATSG